MGWDYCEAFTQRGEKKRTEVERMKAMKKECLKEKDDVTNGEEKRRRSAKKESVFV